MTRLLAFAFLLVSLPASAQTLVAQFSPQASAPIAAPAPSLSAYAGVYTADGGTIEVRDGDSALVVVASGASVAARLGEAVAPSPADAWTATLLDAWISDDLHPMVDAARPSRQALAAESFARYRAALIRGHGDALSSTVVGTFDRTDGQRATLAQIHFEDGTEWASLVWDANGHLVTVTRGLGPVVIGTATPVRADLFSARGVEVAFERGTDGRIDTVIIGDGLVAVR